MARNRFRALKVAVFIGCLAASCVPCLAQRGWKLPEDEWIFEALLNLRNSGLVSPRSSSVFYGLPSRLEVALYSEYVHDELLLRVEEMENQVRSTNRKPISFRETIRELRPILEEAELFLTHADDIQALRRAIEKFRPELSSMKRDVDDLLVGVSIAATRAAEIRQRIAFAGKQRELPFPDVPPRHWVYDALEEGRNRQFFFGYPGELFRGAQFATRDEMAGMINAVYQEARKEVIALQDQLDALILRDRGGPPPPSLREMSLSLARFNWALKHRRELIQFALRF